MKRSDNIAWSQLKVGLFIIVALTFLALGILLMGKRTKFFDDTGALSVLMTDVAGLKVGAPVWLAGIDVGTVTGIRFQRPQASNDVEILLQIQEEIDDLSLDGNIEGAHGLVADDERRIRRESARDADALALPAAELVRKAPHGVGAHADSFEQ